MQNVIRYSCNKISFEPGHMPVPVEQSGLNLFSSQINNIRRLSQAIWFGSITDEQKIGHIMGLSKTIDILTPGERLGNLFILSLFHRCFSVLSSSAKLYIDNSKMKPIYKYAASFVLSAVPSLLLIILMGYSPSELILNACIIQAASAATSYFSLYVGNYLRSLDLISDTKVVNKKEYINRVFISSAIDIILTFVWHGAQLYRDPFKVSDAYHTLHYCVGAENKIETMIMAINLSVSLISIADKLIWLTGRVAVDAILCTAYQFKMVKDIRSPFITFTSAKEGIASVIKKYQAKHTRQEQQKYANANRSRAERQSRSQDTEVETNNYIETYQSSSSTRFSKKDLPAEKVKPKTRKANTNLEVTNEAAEKIAPIDTSITVGDLTFSKLDGPNIQPNTWGVISLRKEPEEMKKFTTSLSSGHVGNQHSAINCINGAFEIRPKGEDRRLFGKINVGIEAFKRVLPLGQAMNLYEKLQTQKTKSQNIDLNLVIFNTWANKHSDINKVIARM